MLENFSMPEIILGSRIKLVARNNHNYDEHCWMEVDKYRLFLREYLPWVDKTNSLQDVSNATDMFIDMWNKKENFAYYIILNSTEKLAGSIDIHNIDYDNHSAEIGYWLSEDYNGNGYMADAVQLIEKQSFEAGLNRIYIRCETENLPSCRVAERTGYKLEGTHKQMLLKNDRFRDVNCYAKLKNA